MCINPFDTVLNCAIGIYLYPHRYIYHVTPSGAVFVMPVVFKTGYLLSTIKIHSSRYTKTNVMKTAFCSLIVLIAITANTQTAHQFNYRAVVRNTGGYGTGLGPNTISMTINTTGITINNSTGSETRPVNAAVNFIIKY